MRDTGALKLTGKCIEEIPDEVFVDGSEAKIEIVHLNRNKLRHLPDKLSIITTVEELEINTNQLETVPDWLGDKLKHLRFLDLSQNFLSTLPNSIEKLQHLYKLNISFNK